MVLNAMLNLAQTAADLVDHLIALLEIGDDLGVSLPLELELALELALVLIVFALSERSWKYVKMPHIVPRLVKTSAATSTSTI